MPRNVRNFWLEGQIDGRSSKIEGGPVAKDGGFFLRIKMRDDGGILNALSIRGTADEDGTLWLEFGADGSDVDVIDAYGGGYRIETKR
jgi:hypothetical protein